MSLYTKLFKKSHDPYELKGRWYKLHVEINGNISSATVTGDTSAFSSYNTAVSSNTAYIYPKAKNGYVASVTTIPKFNNTAPTSGAYVTSQGSLSYYPEANYHRIVICNSSCVSCLKSVDLFLYVVPFEW